MTSSNTPERRYFTIYSSCDSYCNSIVSYLLQHLISLLTALVILLIRVKLLTYCLEDDNRLPCLAECMLRVCNITYLRI